MAIRVVKMDNLTKIKGIGAVRQEWFRKSLNIRTFADLAAQPVDKIDTMLRADGHIVSRKEINAWINEARSLMDVSLKRPEVNFEPLRKQTKVVRESQWKTFAQFFVDFQTRKNADGSEEYQTKVHRMKDGKEMIWSGLDDERVGAWMLDHLNGVKLSKMAKPRKKTATTKQSLAKEAKGQADFQSLVLEIVEVRVYQPVEDHSPIGLGQDGEIFSVPIRGNEPFALDVTFEVKGWATEDGNTPIQYNAQIHAHDRTTGSSVFLGSTKPKSLTADQTAFSAYLPKANLTPGVYRLEVMLTLLTEPGALTFLEIPMFQVF